MKPSLQTSFDGVIWKIETDEENGQIAIETRDPENKSINFSVFDYRSGYCLLEELNSENNWWNLDRLHHHQLYLHGYIRESSPEHKGINAINVNTGQVKWQNYQLALEDISDEGLVVYNPDLYPRKLKILDEATGQTINKEFKSFIPLKRNILFPRAVIPADFPEFIPHNIAGPVFYLKHNDKECWSFHTVNQDIYSQNLLVLANRKIILEDVLAAGIQKLNPEAFFLQQDHLIYVRDNNRGIVSYLL